MRDLRALDDQLEQLSDERKRHALVRETCRTLEALAALGGAPLFWGERVADGASQVRLALGRVDAFEKHVGLLEERRQALLDEIAVQEQGYEIAEDDVLELERQEEQRRLEWIVEREPGPLPVRPIVMPWSSGGEDEQRFRRSLVTAFFVSAALAIVIPQIPLPVPERHSVIEVPERLARLLQQPRPLPPPAHARPADPREKPLPAPEEKPRIANEPVPPPGPQPGEGAGPTTGPAQGAGSGPKGILAFREQLSGLARAAPGAKLGLEARISSAADAASGRPERSLVTSMAPGSNAGINLASMSRGGGGGGRELAGVAVARATSTIGGGGGAPGGGAGTGTGSGAGAQLGRTDEEIQIVFDRHKAELYRLYNRELRNDPTLSGQIVLRMRIEPDGSVSLCALQTTDMEAPQLAAQVVERVSGFDFGAKEGIAAVTILYPIEFLPAT